MTKIKKIVNLFLIAAGFAVFYYFSQKIFLIYISLVLIVGGLLSEKLLNYILKVWMTIGNVLGYINTRIILFLLFYLIITPYAFIMRVFNGSNVILKADTNTMLKISKKKYSSTDLENMW